MAMIEPKSQDERRAEESQFPSGMYVVKLVEVREIGPSTKFPNGNNRLVFDFEVAEGAFKGKRSAYFVGKSLFKNAATGKESNLVKLARSMGVTKPENGFDPDLLLGKHFNAMCERDESSEDGRTWVRAVTPAGAPVGGQGAAGAGAPPRSGPPPRPGQAAPPAEKKFWYADPNGGDAALKTEAELADLVTAGADPNAFEICPEGGDAWGKAVEVLPSLKGIIPF